MKRTVVPVFVLACVFSAIAPAASLAQEQVDLEKILVTPYGFEEEVNRTSASVSVITQSQIKASNARTVPEVLRAHAGIDIKDYYGTGLKVNVDMRGFGEYASSNTLVLIDGRRVNNIDLSGVDWTQIPLDAVERIEVVRGKGSVLYGDNAANGVINIITRTGHGEPAFEFEAKAGSYDFEKQRLSVSGSEGIVSYFLDASRLFTNGYRDNSDLSSRDLAAKFKIAASDVLTLGFSSGFHDADYGMAGALRESHLQTMSRRQTPYPLDTAGEQDWFFMVDSAYTAVDDVVFNTDLSFRQRRQDNQFLSQQSIDGRRMETIGFTPSVTVYKPLFSKENKLICGYDLYRVDSINDGYSFYGLAYYSGAKTRATDIDKDSRALYAEDQFSVTDRLIVNGGYRSERARYSFLSLPQDGPWTADMFWTNTVVTDSLVVKKKAAEVGVSYIYDKNARSNVYADYARNFRLPTTDEYYSLWASPPVNLNLKPQTADSYTVGVNHVFNERMTIKASAFTMSVENELYYDPAAYTNRNYEKTIHRGIETELEFKPARDALLRAGYTFTEAYFNGGAYDKNQIPLVPRHRLFVVCGLVPVESLHWNIGLNYASRQYFLNDQAHAYTRAKEYVTVDTNLAYTFKNATLFVGVNNIFDERYSEYAAISTVYNEKGYFPAPGRNYVVGATIKF
ncbi:MAG: TonB-dependent receptor [Candidatus Omnitrophica bacterium]|nr:TonB-dependent receptor [Candidatus Omnitrophota bacterium]